MLHNKKKRFFAIALMTFTMLCLVLPLSAIAEEVDLTDNDAAVEYLAASESFDADALSDEELENYSTAASTFIDGYSDNVGTADDFDASLEKALDAKRNDVPPFATWLSLLPPILPYSSVLLQVQFCTQASAFPALSTTFLWMALSHQSPTPII